MGCVWGMTTEVVHLLSSSSELDPWVGGSPDRTCLSPADGLLHHRGPPALPFPRLLLLDAGGGRDALPHGQEPEGGELLQLSQCQDAVSLCLWLRAPSAGGGYLCQRAATGLRDAHSVSGISLSPRRSSTPRMLSEVLMRMT